MTMFGARLNCGSYLSPDTASTVNDDLPFDVFDKWLSSDYCLSKQISVLHTVRSTTIDDLARVYVFLRFSASPFQNDNFTIFNTISCPVYRNWRLWQQLVPHSASLEACPKYDYDFARFFLGYIPKPEQHRLALSSHIIQKQSLVKYHSVGFNIVKLRWVSVSQISISQWTMRWNGNHFIEKIWPDLIC